MRLPSTVFLYVCVGVGGCPDTLSVGEQGKSHFHNILRTPFAHFTRLMFALMVDKIGQALGPVWAVTPSCTSSHGVLPYQALAG